MTAMLRRHLADDVAQGSTAATTHGDAAPADGVPVSVICIHLGFLATVVAFAHHPVIFMGLFLMFLGFTQAYERHQSPLNLKEALLVGFFLAGLVVLGGLQAWWLQVSIPVRYLMPNLSLPPPTRPCGVRAAA